MIAYGFVYRFPKKQHMDAALFEHHTQGVRLTVLGEAFDHLAHAVGFLHVQAQPQSVYIATLTSINQLWWLPHLPLLRKKLPDITISIPAMECPIIGGFCRAAS